MLDFDKPRKGLAVPRKALSYLAENTHFFDIIHRVVLKGCVTQPTENIFYNTIVADGREKIRAGFVENPLVFTKIS